MGAIGVTLIIDIYFFNFFRRVKMEKIRKFFSTISSWVKFPYIILREVCEEIDRCYDALSDEQKERLNNLVNDLGKDPMP